MQGSRRVLDPHRCGAKIASSGHYEEPRFPGRDIGDGNRWHGIARPVMLGKKPTGRYQHATEYLDGIDGRDEPWRGRRWSRAWARRGVLAEWGPTLKVHFGSKCSKRREEFLMSENFSASLHFNGDQDAVRNRSTRCRAVPPDHGSGTVSAENSGEYHR